MIFSKSQQQFVVVSELAKSAGKSSTIPKAKVDDLFALLYENLFGNKTDTQSKTDYQLNGSHFAQGNAYPLGDLENVKGISPPDSARFQTRAYKTSKTGTRLEACAIAGGFRTSDGVAGFNIGYSF